MWDVYVREHSVTNILFLLIWRFRDSHRRADNSRIVTWGLLPNWISSCSLTWIANSRPLMKGSLQLLSQSVSEARIQDASHFLFRSTYNTCERNCYRYDLIPRRKRQSKLKRKCQVPTPELIKLLAKGGRQLQNTDIWLGFYRVKIHRKPLDMYSFFHTNGR